MGKHFFRSERSCGNLDLRCDPQARTTVGVGADVARAEAPGQTGGRIFSTTRMSEAGHDLITILMPVYNDWDALSSLLPMLDGALTADGLRAGILLVDDASTIAGPCKFAGRLDSITSVDVLSLRRNLGHQRAIAVGLSYLEANQPQSAVVVMDADGEDDPRDVPRLVRECMAQRGEKIVFAARFRRSEGWKFTLLYHLYRVIHFLLTGVHVRVGNFSIVPPAALKRLVAVSELWNHYAAAVHKAKLPVGFIPSERATRLDGRPGMDLISLVVPQLRERRMFGIDAVITPVGKSNRR